MEHALLTQQVVGVAQRAGRTLMEVFPKLHDSDIEFKASRQDVVTWADRMIEQQIVSDLKQITPGASFLVEESGEAETTSATKWVVDPIDGTRYYVRGLPMFSIAISMVTDGEPQIGVIHYPPTQQTYYAYLGGGAFRDGQRLRGSEITTLSEAIVYLDMHNLEHLSGPEREWFDAKVLELMHNCYRVRMCGAAAFGATWVAAGAVDAFIDLTGYDPPWDGLAGRILMAEAGAVSDTISVQVGPPRLVGANPILRSALVHLLSS